MIRLLLFLKQIIHLYQIVLIITVIMSWIFASGKLNRYDPRVRGIMQALDAVTEPFLRRIRPWMPNTGALDLAPLALWFLCIFIDTVVIDNIIDLLQT